MKSIFVCSLCQKYSQSEGDILEHLSTNHKKHLHPEVEVENFIFKLQSLTPEQNCSLKQEYCKARKSNESVTSCENKASLEATTAGPNGLFWCQKCYKYFKKPRQLLRHICVQASEEDFESEVEVDNDNTHNYRIYNGVNKARRNNKTSTVIPEIVSQKHVKANAEVASVNGKNENCVKHGDYIPLFKTDDERKVFEQHVNSVDLSCVAVMFTIKTREGPKKSRIRYFSCNTCKKVFKKLYNIQMHCLTHTDLRLFTCPLPKCSFASKSKANLYSHMRKHTGNCYACSDCDFKTANRTHLLEHQATHLSNQDQFCKICRGTYKTFKSLVNHVRRYHKNITGEKYLRCLSSKHKKTISCKFCDKKLQEGSLTESSNNKHHCNNLEKSVASVSSEICHEEISKISSEKDIRNTVTSDFVQSNSIELNLDDLEMIKNTLAADLEKNLLTQGPNLDGIQSSLHSDTSLPLVSFHPNPVSSSFSFVESCDNSVLLTQPTLIPNCQRLQLSQPEILTGTLNQSSITNLIDDYQHISDLVDTSSLLDNLGTPAEMKPESSSMATFQNKTTPNITCDIKAEMPELSFEQKNSEERKSAETKLFEKCHLLQAYVCCICSAIYVDSEALKNHLKQHVGNGSMLEDHEEKYDAADINVCDVLKDEEPDIKSFNELVEQLYNSSLGKSYFLPNVTVNVETNPSLFDSFLEDPTNFPINDKFDEAELMPKDNQENMYENYFNDF